MSHATSQLLEQALRLSDRERGDLAARLIDSLDPVPDDEDVETAWDQEIRERLDDLDHNAECRIMPPELRLLVSRKHLACPFV